jgi:hypothetical protein
VIIAPSLSHVNPSACRRQAAPRNDAGQFANVDSWHVRGDVLLYQDTISQVSSLGDPRLFGGNGKLDFSEFHIDTVAIKHHHAVRLTSTQLSQRQAILSSLWSMLAKARTGPPHS